MSLNKQQVTVVSVGQYRLKATDSRPDCRLLDEPHSSFNGHRRELSLHLFFSDFGS